MSHTDLIAALMLLGFTRHDLSSTSITMNAGDRTICNVHINLLQPWLLVAIHKDNAALSLQTFHDNDEAFAYIARQPHG